ncbi:hypothetical protein P3X46_006205 [Hevea brasiliensis]|uniref:Reverse transcriptase domain-containing protein n=1 Tax=Hevea brasiliensis TaxID=3981 RepID=A0ABQ9MPG5_HEVBR|nr:hypothetical protein P3X46_006205 [Hevea brasiliensis]
MQAPSVSHLFFADDSLLFFRAKERECLKIEEILTVYERASSPAVNFQKSGLFFSANISERDRDLFSGVLEVFNPLNHGRYLGLPPLIGSNKRQNFAYVRDRLWKRIHGWQERLLSQAGKEILIKSVAQAIPAYCMSVFLLPISLCEEL